MGWTSRRSSSRDVRTCQNGRAVQSWYARGGECAQELTDHQIEKHPEAAAKYFAAALATARDGAYTDGKREASEALRRVKALIADKS